MKAAVLYKNNEPLVMEEVELLPPKSDEVVIKMIASGVCHSDFAKMRGDRPVALPIVLGHEGAGIVQKVGEKVQSLKAGDRVVLSWIAPCGTCFYCATGKPNLCEEAAANAAKGTMLDGTTRLRKGEKEIHHLNSLATFAEYAVVSERACIPVPDGMPLKVAALVGCAVMTGVGAITNAAKVEAGASVAVFGAGGVGLNCIQGADLAGADKIIAVDVVDWKLEMAKEFGATHVIHSMQEDPVEKIKEITGGRGADYAFDSASLPLTIKQAYQCLRKGGMAVVLGVALSGKNVEIDAMSLPLSEKTLTGSLYGGAVPSVDFPKLMNLYMKGKLKLDQLISKEYTLDEINEAFDDLHSGKLARGVIIFDEE